MGISKKALAIAAITVVGASCGGSTASPGEESLPLETAPISSTTTTLATTSTTAADLTVTYCEESRRASEDGIQYLIQNGASANGDLEFAQIGAEIMATVTPPTEIAEDFALVTDSLDKYVAALEAGNDTLTEPDLEEIWPVQNAAASRRLEKWEEETCGFTFDALAEEAGLLLNQPDTTIEGSTFFTDPEGDYTLEIDPSWTEAHGSVAPGIEVWMLGISPSGVNRNINVLTQNAPGVTLEDYMAISLQSIGAIGSDGEVVSDGYVQSASGERLGFMQYTANLYETDLAFYAVFGVSDGRATLVTVTTTQDDFADFFATYEPYMLTLNQL